MQRSIRITIIALSVLFALAPASRALAQKKRIAVLDIEDAPNDLLGKDIVSILRGQHTVISNDKYKRAAKRLRAETMTAENLSRVAASVKADGVLSGSVTESNGRYVLRLHLRSGRTGKTVQKLRLRLGRARLSKRMRGQLKKQLAVAIKQLRAVDDGRAPKEEDFGNEEEIEVVVGPKAKPGKTKPGETKPGEAKPGDQSGTPDKAGDDEESDDGDDAESVDTGQQDANPESSGAGKASSAQPRVAAATDDKGRGTPRVSKGNRGSRLEPRRREARRAASLMLGASVVMRDLTFTLAEPFPEAPNGYDGPTAPGLNLRGELYPMQFTSLADSILSVLGVAFRVDRVLGLQTAIDTGNQEILAQTTQSSYSVGVRLRYRFAGLPTQPTITLGAGLGKLSFILDDADVPVGVALDVPNTSYAFFDPGVWLRLSAHPRVLVEAGGQVLFITNAGDVQQPEQYGGASIKSYALDGSVEVLITPNWRVRATGTYTSVALTFLGNGEQTYVRDGDPGDIDVLGANDRYLGGVLAVGYTY